MPCGFSQVFPGDDYQTRFFFNLRQRPRPQISIARRHPGRGPLYACRSVSARHKKYLEKVAEPPMFWCLTTVFFCSKGTLRKHMSSFHLHSSSFSTSIKDVRMRLYLFLPCLILLSAIFNKNWTLGFLPWCLRNGRASGMVSIQVHVSRSHLAYAKGPSRKLRWVVIRG